MPTYLIESDGKRQPLARGIMLRTYLEATNFPGIPSPTENAIVLRSEIEITPRLEDYIKNVLGMTIKLI